LLIHHLVCDSCRNLLVDSLPLFLFEFIVYLLSLWKLFVFGNFTRWPHIIQNSFSILPIQIDEVFVHFCLILGKLICHGQTFCARAQLLRLELT